MKVTPLFSGAGMCPDLLRGFPFSAEGTRLSAPLFSYLYTFFQSTTTGNSVFKPWVGVANRQPTGLLALAVSEATLANVLGKKLLIYRPKLLCFLPQFLFGFCGGKISDSLTFIPSVPFR
jgi:hypothetical protein